MLLYWLARFCAAVLQRLPVRLGYALADRLADVAFLLWRRGRTNMMDNVAHVLGPEASQETVRTIARKALRNYARYLVDFLCVRRWTPEEIERRVRFEQWRPLEEALSAGRGAIFVGIHMGHWDLGGALLAMKGYTLNVVVDTFSNPAMNRFVQGARERLGMKTIPRESAARRVLQALRRNEVLCLLMDRPTPPEEGVAIDLFGRPAVVPAGAAVLSLRTGAPVVPMSMLRLSDSTFVGVADRCISYKPTGNHEDDVRALTQQIMDPLARWVQEYPDQWFMFRRMWPASAPEAVPVSA